MKNIVKMIALVMAVLMLSVCFFACNKEESDNTPKSFYVTYKGVKIELGKNADNVVENIGDVLSVNELGDCGGLGAQIKYTYASLAIYVLEDKDGNAVIDGIELYDDSITTPEGVYIGMSASDAKAKLGGAKESGNALTVIDGKYYVKVKLDGGKVSEIHFGTDSAN